MEQLVCGIVRDEKGGILVVDKPKNDDRILTILPGGKVTLGESLAEALIREIREELGVAAKVGKKLGQLVGTSPTSQIERKIFYYEVQIFGIIRTDAEIKNPRFLSLEEVNRLGTTTQITKNIILGLMNKT